MQLPDETVEYHYQRLLTGPYEEWTPLVELQGQNFLSPARIKAMAPLAIQVRGQIAAEREIPTPPPDLVPLHAGFIDLPTKLLEAHRKKAETSDLGRILALAGRLKGQVDRVVVLGIGGSYLGARTLFESLCHTYHNDLPAKVRLGKPRMYFEGNNVDNDALADLLELLENTCVDPDIPEERWGLIVVSKSGGTIETAAAYRVFRKEIGKLYGPSSPMLKQSIVPITGPTGKLRELLKADGFGDDDILTIPDNVGGRYSVFTACGLLPAAVVGLDIRALLLGAQAMTRRFLEEPFERNPVLQYAVVNHLMTTELDKTTRVMAVWSKKLEALGLWYDQLLAESLGKMGRGPTPVSAVCTRDLHSRGQQHQDGTRDKMINNVLVKTAKSLPIPISMEDRNEDDLNQYNRKTLPDILKAAATGTNQAYQDAARPTADLVVPALSEHTMGQLLQLLMLATVVEGRLCGINPYGQPGVEAYKRNMTRELKKA